MWDPKHPKKDQQNRPHLYIFESFFARQFPGWVSTSSPGGRIRMTCLGDRESQAKPTHLPQLHPDLEGRSSP